MGSDTSNYPPWCCWHQWTFINTQVRGSQSHGVIVELSQWGSSEHGAVIKPLRANNARQCPVSPVRPGVMRLMMSMPVLTLSHPRDTVMPRVTLRDYLASRHTDTRVTSPKLCWVSRLLIGHRVLMLASDWLWVAQSWLVICIILASLACDDWARLSTQMIMNIHRLKNGLPVMSDFWDIQISNVIIMTQRHHGSIITCPPISGAHHECSVTHCTFCLFNFFWK